METMFFDGWFNLIRIVVVGSIAYAVLLVFMRISGKRTLSKWNKFDFVATIAIGSTLATVLLSKDIVLVEGVVGLALLIAIQFLITWMAVKSGFVHDLITGEPVMLFRNGKPLKDELEKQRVTEAELLAAIRLSGAGSIEDVEAVVLETQGDFSVIRRSDIGNGSALRNVRNFREGDE